MAREEVILTYRNYLRHKKLAEVVWMNKMSVVAAGVYEGPIDGLNEATSSYLDKLDLSVGEDSAPKSKQQSDQELYEEWKRLFGKIED